MKVCNNEKIKNDGKGINHKKIILKPKIFIYLLQPNL